MFSYMDSDTPMFPYGIKDTPTFSYIWSWTLPHFYIRFQTLPHVHMNLRANFYRKFLSHSHISIYGLGHYCISICGKNTYSLSCDGLCVRCQILYFRLRSMCIMCIRWENSINLKHHSDCVKALKCVSSVHKKPRELSAVIHFPPDDSTEKDGVVFKAV